MKTTFTVEIETPEGEYVFSTYSVEWDIEPAQKGGLIDPSWDAYPYLEGITDEAGNPVNESPSLVRAAEAAMRGAFSDQVDYDDTTDGYDYIYDGREYY